jgi:predicted phage tail component-like protein
MTEIVFNNLNSYKDMDIVIEQISIQPPSKKKIKESVPFMNGTYDFSTVGSNGEIVYEERTIKIRFNFVESNRSILYAKYTKVMEWLLGTGQQQLIFMDMPDCYFLAEVENAPSFEELYTRVGILEVEFIAYPFKQGVNLIGQEYWDTFNFEFDYMQDSEFDIPGSLTTKIHNPGRIIVPIVNCSSSMTVSINGYTASFASGNNRDWKFKLKPGENNLTINGSGHIKFTFRKEVL